MTAWSYSYLQAFETCGRRFYLTKILKTVVEPQTEATISGNQVHKAIEQHIKGEQWLPEKYKRYIPIVEAVKASPGIKHVEYKFGLTKQLHTTGFFAKDVWVRGVYDLAAVKPNTVTIVDWKTGKPKSDTDQLELFAVTAFSVFPHAKTIRTAYAWLGHDRLDAAQYTRDDAARLWDNFKSRVQRLETAIEDEKFPPKPSGLCRAWCPVTKNQCEFSGRS
jgi:ATP-dependent exoDNAse (exonuclease V) beta subunit